MWDHGFWQLFSSLGEKTIQIVKLAGNMKNEEGWLLSEQGWLRMEWGDYSDAEKLLQEAKIIFYACGDQRGICVIERYIGVLAYRKENLELASFQYRLAEDISRKNNFDLMLAEIYNLEGSLERRRGNLIEARDFYIKSKELIEKLGDPMQLTATLRNLARLEAQLGNLDVARDKFNQVIELCIQIDRRDMLFSCQARLAEVELKSGNISRAKELALKARDGFILIGNKKDEEQINLFLEALP